MSAPVHILCFLALWINHSHSDEPLRGPVQEFNFDSDEEDDGQLLPSQVKKSKQFERPVKVIPTASDASDSDDSNEDIRVTMANMEARSRALDATAATNAELDAEELRREALEAEDKNMSDDQEVDMKIRLPTAAEREEEKAKGGPDVQTVQERMRYCVRVLGSFKKRAEKGRWVFSRV